ncbi:membrane protein, partial [Microbacterium sp. SUBG005]
PHARHVLSRLTFFVLSPFLLFTVLATADVATLFSALLPVSMITAAVIIAVSVLISALLLRRPVGETVIGALSAGQVNSNNIGIPISLYMLGNAAYSARSSCSSCSSSCRSPWGILDAPRARGA